jgi:hypothetical protein
MRKCWENQNVGHSTEARATALYRSAKSQAQKLEVWDGLSSKPPIGLPPAIGTIKSDQHWSANMRTWRAIQAGSGCDRF